MKLEGSTCAVELGQAAFGEAPEALDAVDMDVSVGEGVALLAVLLDAQMLLVAPVDKPRITAPSVADDSGFAGDVTSDKSL